MNEYVLLAAGFVCAAMGGELFVRGSVQLALWARVSPGIVGATVAAFATSSPEFAVSVSSALAGTPAIALGDALGSNLVNVSLILALAVLFSRMRVDPGAVRRDYRFALGAPAIMGFLLHDGVLAGLDALLLLGVFFSWLWLVLKDVRNQRTSGDVSRAPVDAWRTVVICVCGLGFLIAGGHMIVTGASAVALSYGIDAFLVGATIVAIGTTVPELATTVIAALRGHHALGFGTILGSNLFNGLFVVGIAATITPISVPWQAVATTLGFGVLALAIVFPSGDGRMSRWRGFALLALYCAYFTVLQFKTGA